MGPFSARHHATFREHSPILRDRKCREGNRLGYGKGFYDRFLADFDGVTIGLCYSEFLLEEIPTGENDRRVDIVVSDTEEVYIHE